VSPQDYLGLSFDGPDREYVDGQVVERNRGERLHSEIQGRLIELFYELRKVKALYARPELRLRLAETTYRIPDVSVFAATPPAQSVPDTPPYIAIEIVSPDDRYSALVEKLEEYRAWGVGHVWLIDPQTQKLAEAGSDGLRFTGSLRMPEFDAELTHHQIFG
jgi:Uma2 family endonuclease